VPDFLLLNRITDTISDSNDTEHDPKNQKTKPAGEMKKGT